MKKTFERTMGIFIALTLFSAFGIVVSIGIGPSYSSEWTSVEKATVNKNINSELPEIEIKNVDEPYKY